MTNDQIEAAKTELLGGYSEAELRLAFDRVCNASDWKAPIRNAVSATELAITLYAIEFFTATKAKARPISLLCGVAGSVPGYVVEAAGYRAGPAGDGEGRS